jgi:hypothetical protein
MKAILGGRIAIFLIVMQMGAFLSDGSFQDNHRIISPFDLR